MLFLLLLVIVIICFLVFFMFLVLSKTVKTISKQSKNYFVGKLQEYDYLINEKEEKLKRINEEIKNKEKIEKEEEYLKEHNSIDFDYKVIDLFNKAEYQDKNIFEINKKINNRFVIDYEALVKDFLKHTKKDDKYEFCLLLRKKFDSEEIYKIKILTNSGKEEYLKDFLKEEEYKVYEAYKYTMNDNTIEGFIDYLDQLVDLNNPNIKIIVGNDEENYDHLSKFIKTVVSDEVYKGIKIIYKNKIYDYSLNERNI